jgi:hypothetical protein
MVCRFLFDPEETKIFQELMLLFFAHFFCKRPQPLISPSAGVTC